MLHRESGETPDDWTEAKIYRREICSDPRESFMDVGESGSPGFPRSSSVFLDLKEERLGEGIISTESVCGKKTEFTLKNVFSIVRR